MTIDELRARRAQLVQQVRALIDAAQGRDLTEDEERQVGDLQNQAGAAQRRIEIEARQLELERQRAQSELNPSTPEPGRSTGDAAERSRLMAAGLRSYLLGQPLPEECRNLEPISDALSVQLRAMGVNVGAEGAFLIDPLDLVRREVLEAVNPLRRLCTVEPTDGPNPLPVMIESDVAVGEMMREGDEAGEDNFAGDKLRTSIGVLYHSKVVRISRGYLDFVNGAESRIVDRLTRRIERGFLRSVLTNTLPTGPRGLIPSTTVGRTTATGQTGTVLYDDYVELLGSLAPEYQTSSTFLVSPRALTEARKLKSQDGFPLFNRDGLAGGAAGTILDRPYALCADLETVAAGKVPILCGDTSEIVLRDASPLIIIRLAELYAKRFQVGFVAFRYHDAYLAVDQAMRSLKMAS
jgi:HK97 family phage major capsid protein